MKIKKIQRVSALCFAVFCTLFIGTAYRMETCGYDCGLFSISAGMAVVVYYVIFFGLGLISLIAFVGVRLYILRTTNSENQLKFFKGLVSIELGYSYAKQQVSQHMVWLGIMIYSALIGAFFAYKCSNKYGIFGALVVPFTGFAILTLIEVYFWPGGGAPMLLLVWLIALPLTAITSFVSYMLVEAFIQSKAQQNK